METTTTLAYVESQMGWRFIPTRMEMWSGLRFAPTGLLRSFQ
jgi:hypothetical protein